MKNNFFKKSATKPILPILTLDSAYLDTSPTKPNDTINSQNPFPKQLSPSTTKSKTAKRRILKTAYRTHMTQLNEDDEEGIYNLSEIKKLKLERNLPDATITTMKRMWDAYPQKQNVLQDVRRQYSAFINTKKIPKLDDQSSTVELESKIVNKKNKVEEEYLYYLIFVIIIYNKIANW